MKIELPLQEVQDFLRNFYKLDVELENTSEGEVKIHYIASMLVTIKQAKGDTLILSYDVSGLVRLLAKSVLIFYRKKLENIPVDLNTDTQEITIDLKRFPELKEVLKYLSIAGLQFKNENIMLQLDLNPSEIL